MSKNGGIIGVSDHGGWAVLVTVARDGTLLDRRRVELVDDDLPAIPHHHEAQVLPLERGRGVGRARARFGGAPRSTCTGRRRAAVPHIRGVAFVNTNRFRLLLPNESRTTVHGTSPTG